jgi:hypothetical protein
MSYKQSSSIDLSPGPHSADLVFYSSSPEQNQNTGDVLINKAYAAAVPPGKLQKPFDSKRKDLISGNLKAASPVSLAAVRRDERVQPAPSLAPVQRVEKGNTSGDVSGGEGGEGISDELVNQDQNDFQVSTCDFNFAPV